MPGTYQWHLPAGKLFLSTQDLNAIVKDDNSDWHKLLAGFLESQQTNE